MRCYIFIVRQSLPIVYLQGWQPQRNQLPIYNLSPGPFRLAHVLNSKRSTASRLPSKSKNIVILMMHKSRFNRFLNSLIDLSGSRPSQDVHASRLTESDTPREDGPDSLGA